MKKLCAVVCLLFLAGCNRYENALRIEAQPGSLDEKTYLVMGTEAGFAPYEYYSEEGEIVGVDPDIAQAIAQALDKELYIVELDFDEIIYEVEAGRVDFGAAGMTVEKERSQIVDFSIPYATSKQVILVRCDNTDIKGPETLPGKVVGVQNGTVAESVLQKDYQGVSVESYQKYMEGLADLLNGRIDAVVMDLLPACEFSRENPELMILEQHLMADEYAIAVQKGNDEMLDAVNRELQNLIDAGKIEEFTRQHTVG